MYVEYSSNNSGGSWWLKDKDWYALEKAGWEVDWYAKRTDGICKTDSDGRWLGALASGATKRDCSSLHEAVDEWERITSGVSTDAGCPCCGPPHHFTLYSDDGKYIDSGPETSYSASW